MERWRDWRREGWVWVLFMASTWTLAWSLTCNGTPLSAMDASEAKESTNNSETPTSNCTGKLYCTVSGTRALGSKCYSQHICRSSMENWGKKTPVKMLDIAYQR